jgi:hypothetical protein
MKIVFRKSKCKDDKLEHFRKLIMDHLDTLDVMEKAKFPIGTIRDWKGKKYIKVGENKWKPKYDNESRGAKLAVAAIKRKVANAKDAKEMMDIVLENRDRFSDKDGHPLPFVQELSEYVRAQGDSVDGKKEKPKQEKEKTPKTKPQETVGKKDKSEKEKTREAPEIIADIVDYDGTIDVSRLEKGENVLIGNGYHRWSIDKKVYGYTVDFINVNHRVHQNIGTYKTAKEAIEAAKNNIESSYKNIPDNFEVKYEDINDYLKRWDESHAKKSETPAMGKPTELVDNNGKVSIEGAKKIEDHNDEFKKIQNKYQSAKSIDGDDDEIQIGKESITGKWKLVEADTPVASHDETSFTKTSGFPTNEDGSTINDRDYEKDTAAQNAVMEIASDYDSQALSYDSPVIVTKDGIVISGNNRTMSGKIAAKKGTDKKYIEGLKKKAKKFGFTPDQVGQFKNPRVIFETDSNEGYSTRQFSKFNESDKKAMNPIESAVKVSKIIKPDTIEGIAQRISEFDTLGELYANKKSVNDIFNTLQRDQVIGQFDRPQYVTEEGITGAGKEFLETVLIGSVLNEQNIRGLNREGCKSIRQKLVRAITPLIENKGMAGYSITNELNKAVNIIMQVATNKDKFNGVEEYSKQQNMFEEDDKVSVELAKKLEGTQKEFADFMQSVNGGLRYAANGEADIFLGGVETKEDILSRFFEIKKALLDSVINGALKFFCRVRNGKEKFEKKKVVLNRSGESVEQYRWVAGDDESLEKSLTDSPKILNEKFVRAFYDFFKDEDGAVNLHKNCFKIKELDGYPEGVDMENCEFRSMGADTVTIEAGGDWQQMVNITLGEKNGKLEIVNLYDGNALMNRKDLNQRIKEICIICDDGEIKKSLTYSGHPLQGRTRVQGMDISIENKKGSTRCGVDKDGHSWSCKMNFSYGYVRGTVGVDKDHLDVYVGDNPESEIVFIVNQNDPVTGKFDEQKVMLGFNTEAEAKEAYLKQYDRPGFFGDIIKMDIDTFKDKAFDPENKGRVLEKSYKDLSKLTKQVIIDKNGHRKTVYVKLEDMPKQQGKRVNEERIAELESKLSETEEKPVIKTDKGYLNWRNGEIQFVEKKEHATPIGKEGIKKFKAKHPDLKCEIETKSVLVLDENNCGNNYRHREYIKGLKEELRVLKLGYESIKEYERVKTKENKTKNEDKIESPATIISRLKTILSGYDVNFHTDKSRISDSQYLYINFPDKSSYKIRISDHYMPTHSDDPNYAHERSGEGVTEFWSFENDKYDEVKKVVMDLLIQHKTPKLKRPSWIENVPALIDDYFESPEYKGDDRKEYDDLTNILTITQKEIQEHNKETAHFYYRFNTFRDLMKYVYVDEIPLFFQKLLEKHGVE